MGIPFDALTFLSIGLMVVFKLGMLIKKESKNFDIKRSGTVKMGKILLGVSAILLMSSIFISPENS